MAYILAASAALAVTVLALVLCAMRHIQSDLDRSWDWQSPKGPDH